MLTAGCDQAAATYRLLPALYTCRDPPYLSELVARVPVRGGVSAGTWLAPLVASDPALLSVLPVPPIFALAVDAAERNVRCTMCQPHACLSRAPHTRPCLCAAPLAAAGCGVG
jgi:hypothetical protein